MNYDPKLAANITATGQNILIPMIRKTMPGMIARQIVGVQPMLGAGGKSIFNQFFDKKHKAMNQ